MKPYICKRGLYWWVVRSREKGLEFDPYTSPMAWAVMFTSFDECVCLLPLVVDHFNKTFSSQGEIR